MGTILVNLMKIVPTTWFSYLTETQTMRISWKSMTKKLLVSLVKLLKQPKRMKMRRMKMTTTNIMKRMQRKLSTATVSGIINFGELGHLRLDKTRNLIQEVCKDVD